MSSTGLMPAGVDGELSVRPRNRRGQSAQPSGNATPSLTPGQSPSTSRGVSPIAPRIANAKASSSGRASPSNAFSKGLLEGAWTPNWASVQDFASSLMAGGDIGYSSEPSPPSSRNSNKGKPKSIWKNFVRAGGGPTTTTTGGTWGPAPPPKSRPTAEDIAAGSLREREAKLTARKKASILQSHDGVNGGLDIVGKYKRRNSDELPSTAETSAPVDEEHLVYLHHVQPTDTYAGIVLRYRCQEQAFRRTNGLWSQNNIQIRKHLLIPVDACELKGRPCGAPSYYSDRVDLLAGTPQPLKPDGHDDFFSAANTRPTDQLRQDDEERQQQEPWTHVRWVMLDSIQTPVEIVRVSRRAMSYFPPRRKRSINTVSAFSTPRHSLDLSRAMTNTSEATGSPAQNPSRRQSSMGSRPIIGNLASSPSTRGRVSSIGETDRVPSWMRKPGGVGSMSRGVHAPGPARDSLNNWVNKRLPGFNIDSLPSMSIMGSESAHFGFKKDESSDIVESPFEDGHATTVAHPRNGAGLEQAAASVESWLRGAWAKRPGTPRAGSYRQEDSDLIELTDTNSDDGRLGGLHGGRALDYGLLDQEIQGSTGRRDGEGTVRGRAGTGLGFTRGKKSD